MKDRKKKFINLPEFPGGKEAYKKYIKDNLVYPKQALENKIQGMVHLKAEIDDNGNVLNVAVEKGLGFGCDEEAIRLLKNIQFGGVKNRGVRVKTSKKFRIAFKLPPSKKLNYRIVNKSKQPAGKENTKSKTYTYTLNIDNLQK